MILARRPPSAGRRSLGVSLLLLAASGCHRLPPAARPYPAPQAAELLDAIRGRHRAVRSMNARARATSWLGGERVRATVQMLVARCGALRFEAEVSLQGTVAILTATGADFALLDLRKNLFRRGPSCPANVSSLIRIPLDTYEIAALLLGDVALVPVACGGDPARARPTDDAPALNAEVRWDAASGTEVLAVRRSPTPASPGSEILTSFRRRGGGWDIVAVEGPSAKGRWKVLYEDFRAVGGVRMPAVIRFAEDGRSFDAGVEIKLKEMIVDQEIPPDRFRLQPPPGVTVEEVGCKS